MSKSIQIKKTDRTPRPEHTDTPSAPASTPVVLSDITTVIAEHESKTSSPCTEREVLAVTIGGAVFADGRTISAMLADWQEAGEEPSTQINVEIDGDPIVCEEPDQARDVATKLHRLADHTEVLAGKVGPVEKKQPYWLKEPCPAWCDATHKDNDYQEDRDHYTSFLNIDLTLYDAEGEGGHDGAPGMMIVSASQHYRQGEPEIAINVPMAGNPARRYLVTGEQDVHLTVDEVRQLRDQLSQLLAKLDGGVA